MIKIRMRSPRSSLSPTLHQPSPKEQKIFPVLSNQEIKRHILLTSGPVTTYRTFAKQGSPYLRNITKQQYSDAVNGLQAANLGDVITLQKGARPESIVYIKRHPNIIQSVLEAEDLISLQEYADKYNRPTPSGMNMNVRSKVVELGFVTEEQMKSRPVNKFPPISQVS